LDSVKYSAESDELLLVYEEAVLATVFDVAEKIAANKIVASSKRTISVLVWLMEQVLFRLFCICYFFGSLYFFGFFVL
jgi:hypothetical protein